MNAPSIASRAIAAAAPVAATLALSLGGCKRSPPAPPAAAQRLQADSPDRQKHYAQALAAANLFCRAWHQGDLAAGTALLSPHARRTFSNRRIHDAVAGTGNPRHTAFEIADGRELAPGRIAFRLRLFYTYTGQAEQRIESSNDTIVLAREDSGHWVVDAFPLLEKPEP